MFEEKNIILASSSPRRKELLEKAGIAFKMRISHANEDIPDNMSSEKAPVYLAGKKAEMVQKRSADNELILAADTIVLLGNKILGKPDNDRHAKEILRLLSGKMHRVITGVCLLQGKREIQFSETTKVYFYPLTEAQINYYVENYHPMDKAGAYAIQEWIGLTGIEKIEGDYFNVVGLPIGRVIKEIEKL
ncbi:MAG: septum formation protein Maf [Chitinophagaceae bacterium]|nr:MAG: septum formation protein Maf [Chitinophagaceae bacterium]